MTENVREKTICSLLKQYFLIFSHDGLLNNITIYIKICKRCNDENIIKACIKLNKYNKRAISRSQRRRYNDDVQS